METLLPSGKAPYEPKHLLRRTHQQSSQMFCQRFRSLFTATRMVRGASSTLRWGATCRESATRSTRRHSKRTHRVLCQEEERGGGNGSLCLVGPTGAGGALRRGKRAAFGAKKRRRLALFSLVTSRSGPGGLGDSAPTRLRCHSNNPAGGTFFQAKRPSKRPALISPKLLGGASW